MEGFLKSDTIWGLLLSFRRLSMKRKSTKDNKYFWESSTKIRTLDGILSWKSIFTVFYWQKVFWRSCLEVCYTQKPFERYSIATSTFGGFLQKEGLWKVVYTWKSFLIYIFISGTPFTRLRALVGHFKIFHLLFYFRRTFGGLLSKEGLFVSSIK